MLSRISLTDKTIKTISNYNNSSNFCQDDNEKSFTERTNLKGMSYQLTKKKSCTNLKGMSYQMTEKQLFITLFENNLSFSNLLLILM